MAMSAYEDDDKIEQIARITYAQQRGASKLPLPPYLELTWDELSDDERVLYVALVRAGWRAVHWPKEDGEGGVTEDE